VVDKFYAKSDVAFGDVALSSHQVKTIHGTEQGAGAGGWPTVRHFNKATGYGGAAYAKKTSQAMCDELGPSTDYMQEHIEEVGGVSLCDVKDTSAGCSDQQVKFIAKWTGKGKNDLEKQITRLEGMADKDGASMKADALQWVKQRIGIFKQLSKEEL